MQITFVSNYLNHHQIPFCKAMNSMTDFNFIQVYDMEETRVKMGWGVNLNEYPFAISYSKEETRCKSLIVDSDIVIFGGVDDESYIKPRLELNKVTIRYSERIYKEGQWKFISPRGLKKKYEDHVRYNNSPVYLLCAGAYVASDFSLIHAYKNKMFTWGYFPEIIRYSEKELHEKRRNNDKLEILWTGRMIDWKHPESAIKVAKALKANEINYHMTILGEGEMRTTIEKMAITENVYADITFSDFAKPSEIREYMRKADIYLFTSDYKEGWGAVLNESMNSGCAVAASSGIGAVPYLLKHNVNGMVYKTGNDDELVNEVLELSKDKDKREMLGNEAYKTVSTKWNPEIAAKRFMTFAEQIVKLDGTKDSISKLIIEQDGPLSRADIISPSKGYAYCKM